MQGTTRETNYLNDTQALSQILDIQFPNELSREDSMAGQSTAVLLYKNRTLV